MTYDQEGTLQIVFQCLQEAILTASDQEAENIHECLIWLKQDFPEVDFTG